MLIAILKVSILSNERRTQSELEKALEGGPEVKKGLPPELTGGLIALTGPSLCDIRLERWDKVDSTWPCTERET